MGVEARLCNGKKFAIEFWLQSARNGGGLVNVGGVIMLAVAVENRPRQS